MVMGRFPEGGFDTHRIEYLQSFRHPLCRKSRRQRLRHIRNVKLIADAGFLMAIRPFGFSNLVGKTVHADHSPV
ncbi:hypothetical protein D3C80_2201780 [compost metagenome]